MFALENFLLSYSLVTFERFYFVDYISFCICLEISKVSLSLSLKRARSNMAASLLINQIKWLISIENYIENEKNTNRFNMNAK